MRNYQEPTLILIKLNDQDCIRTSPQSIFGDFTETETGEKDFFD